MNYRGNKPLYKGFAQHREIVLFVMLVLGVRIRKGEYCNPFVVFVCLVAEAV